MAMYSRFLLRTMFKSVSVCKNEERMLYKDFCIPRNRMREADRPVAMFIAFPHHFPVDVAVAVGLARNRNDEPIGYRITSGCSYARANFQDQTWTANPTSTQHSSVSM